MNIRSLPVRIALMVTAAFAVVLLIASLFLLSWFEGRLLAEVKTDDSEELDRQVKVLTDLESLLIEEPDGFNQIVEGGLLALIPDDGTLITIRDANGTLIGSSSASLSDITGSGSFSENAIPDYDGMSEEDVLAGLAALPEFHQLLISDLPPETIEEYSEVMQIVSLEAESATEFAESLNQEDQERYNEYQEVLANLIFGSGERSAAPEGRLVISERELTIFDQDLIIRAESRVAGIDHSLSAIRTVLWFANPILLLLAAVMAYVAAQRALRPVAAITARVDGITSAESSARVPVPSTGDEIANLALTMNQMLDRLEYSALNQRRFVSDLSHELRTPAAVIRAEVEVALTEQDNDWDATALSVLAEQSRLSSLVDDLILLARLDESRLSATAKGALGVELDLDDLVRQEAARGWDHKVDTSEVQPVRFEGDPRQLSRLIQNLMANADRHANSAIIVSLETKSGEIVLRIDDDGAGIPADEREMVFNRFTRLDEGRVRDSGGSGLGLAIVREVAEAHNGNVAVTDSPIGGARFEIRFAS